jgi:hypothetical protein
VFCTNLKRGLCLRQPNQALPANPVKNTGRKKRENSGAGKLGLSRLLNHAKRDTIFIKQCTAKFMAYIGFGS